MHGTNIAVDWRRPGRGMRAVIAGMVAVLLLTAGVGAAAQADEQAGCADADHPGGDWTGLNADVTNSRHQVDEDVIGPDEARSLSAVWATSFADAGASGSPQSTPTVANGCVFVGTTGGWVLALNADTGAPVWTFSSERDADVLGGPIMGVSYLDGLVYFGLASPNSPRAGALDADTGELVWLTDGLTEGPHEGNSIYSSPVAFDLGPAGGEDEGALRKMVFITISSAQGPGTRVPYYLLDAETGEVAHRGFPIPEEDMEQGYGGGGIWATAAVDVEDRYLYVGTSDPETYTKEHPHNAAVLQIDVDPGRETFGEVVGAQKGRFDGYVPGGDRHEACEMFGDDTPVIAGESSPVCGQLDVGDFGASPNLFVDEEGHKVITVMQKSGVFFAIDTRTMTLKWEAILSYPLAWGNAATAAVGDGGIYVPADPAVVYGLNSIGWIDWVMPSLADAGRYAPATLANGVVYSPSLSGSLQAWDALTGAPLLNQPMAVDVGEPCAVLGGGVAIARNTVYGQCDITGAAGGWIIAYQPN